MFDSDLASIFADDSVTVPVVFGDEPTEQSTNGILSSEDVLTPDGFGGVVTVSRQVVVVAEGSLSGLVDDAAITVNGKLYAIHNILAGGRGRTRILLAGGT